MDSLLFNNPELKQLALNNLKECIDVQEFGRKMIELLFNSCMSAQADIVCNAEYGKSSETRTNQRNGYRERHLLTSEGVLNLKIPKLRSGSFFPEDLIERYCRVDKSLIAAIAEMYVMGISTGKVEKVVEAFGIPEMSKSQVSRMCSELDEEVSAFRTRRFDEIRFAYLYLDATYVRCRIDHKSVSQAFVTAIGLGEDGHKRFLGTDCIDTESYIDWKEFLSDIKERGMCDVKLVISDDHKGLVKAIDEVFLGAAHQRCVTHLMRNVEFHIHKQSDQKLAREMLKATFAQKTPLTIRACYQKATEEIGKLSNRAGSILLEAEDEALSYIHFPVSHWTKIRTNNIQERTNREIKRRYRVVQCFPSKESLIRLVCSALIETEQDWMSRCVLSKAQMTHAFNPRTIQTPTEEEVKQARQRAYMIIEGVIDACSSKN